MFAHTVAPCLQQCMQKIKAAMMPAKLTVLRKKRMASPGMVEAAEAGEPGTGTVFERTQSNSSGGSSGGPGAASSPGMDAVSEESPLVGGEGASDAPQ